MVAKLSARYKRFPSELHKLPTSELALMWAEYTQEIKTEVAKTGPPVKIKVPPGKR